MADCKTITRCRWLAAVAAIVVTVGLWDPAGRPADGMEVVDRIVAMVNDDVILVSELEAAMAPYTEKMSQMGYAAEKEQQLRYNLREDILAQLIDRTLTDQEVKRLGLSVEPAEIDSAIERVKAANFFTDEALREAIRQQGYTLEQYRNNVRDQILRTKLVNREIRSRTVITSQDVKAYYDSHPEEFGGQRSYHLRTILLPHTLSDLEQARQTVSEALEGGMPFADAARRFSHAPQGGELGGFPLASLAPLVREAVEGLAEGHYGPWLNTDQGYQRFYLEKIDITEGKTLAAVEAQIQETLYKQFVDEKFRSWLETLRKRSHIRIVK